jgi:DNA-binding NarL/FixJ family response regulator
MSITVSIVEDNKGTREQLIKLFNNAPSMRCVNAYSNGEDAIAGIGKDTPDVALVDINLPRMSGIEVVAAIKQKCPSMQVLMLTTYEETEMIFDSLRSGANGYLLKNMSAAELVQAVQDVRAGGAPMSMQIARKVVSHFHHMRTGSSEMSELSPRENEILKLLAEGFLYKEIAEKLNITMSTVRTHIHSVYEKLHVQTRTEAVVKYLGR